MFHIPWHYIKNSLSPFTHATDKSDYRQDFHEKHARIKSSKLGDNIPAAKEVIHKTNYRFNSLIKTRAKRSVFPCLVGD